MGYDRYPRGTQPGDYYDRQDDFGRDYGSGRDYAYSSARDYQAAGMDGRNESRRHGARDYPARDYREQGNRDQGGYHYGPRDQGGSDYYGSRDYGSDDYGSQRYGRGQYAQGRYSQGQYSQGQYPQGQYSQGQGGRQTYGGDRSRYDTGSRYGRYDEGRGGQYGRGTPQGYDYEDRGFFARAGDEVRSWFGDDEAERRREQDARYDGRDQSRDFDGRPRNDRDDDYSSWRTGQIASLDRDYDEYRRENRSKFENEFSSWRTNRQGQRDSLNKVQEHMEVVGSDGAAVGTVDKVRGDRILLTKNDAEAGGHHHSIPSNWIATVDKQVKLGRTAEEAKTAWRDEERSGALFNYGDRPSDDSNDVTRGRTLNRSFSGTY